MFRWTNQNEFLELINLNYPSTSEIQLTITKYYFFTIAHITIPLCIVPVSFLLYTWFTQQVTIPQHMRCFFKTFYSPLYFPLYYFNFPYKCRWFPFFFYTWSAIPDFSTSPQYIDFRCCSSLTFSGRHVLPLYILLQLHRMEYIQFLVMFYSIRSLTLKRYFWRVMLLLNIVLTSHGLYIFRIFSAGHLTHWDEFSGIVLCLGAIVTCPLTYTSGYSLVLVKQHPVMNGSDESPFYDLNLSSQIKKRDKFEINYINRTFLSQTTL